MHANNLNSKPAASGAISVLLGLLVVFSILIPSAKAATPIFTGCPEYLNGSHCDSIYYQVVAADTSTTGNRNNIRYHLVRGPGEIDERTGLWQFHPELGIDSVFLKNGRLLVDIAASIGNDTTHDDENCRFFSGGVNAPPYLTWDYGHGSREIEAGELFESVIVFKDPDSCDTPELVGVRVVPSIVGELSLDLQTGELKFTPTEEDSGHSYTIQVTATDGIDTSRSSLVIEVGPPEPITVRIDKAYDVWGGGKYKVDVLLNPNRNLIERFDFEIGYDKNAVEFMKPDMENSYFQNVCGWNNFTFSRRTSGCGGDCPSGMIRVQGSSRFGGHNEPLDSISGNLDTEQILFSMIMKVSDSHCLNCAFIPVKFHWISCGSNSIRNYNGSVRYISNTVKDWDYYRTGIEDVGPAEDLYSGLGAPEMCISPKYYNRRINFQHGGLSMICVDTIDQKGDLNLDGLSYTLTDAQIYADYFTKGDEAFEICSLFPNLEECLDLMYFNSDINNDSIGPAVDDFAYMVGVIHGTVLPISIEQCLASERTYSNNRASVYYEGGLKYLTVQTVDTLNVLWLRIRGEVVPEVPSAPGMTVDYRYDGVRTNIFIYSLAGDLLPQEFVVSWTGAVGRFSGIQAATHKGEFVFMEIKIPTAVESDEANGLPVSFALHQNYPNPFNPNTQISFDLPEASEVSLQIYNILGRLVRTVQAGSMVAGSHTLSWDGRNHSGQAVTSGIYLYRLEAGDFVATRKMLLLK